MIVGGVFIEYYAGNIPLSITETDNKEDEVKSPHTSYLVAAGSAINAQLVL